MNIGRNESSNWRRNQKGELVVGGLSVVTIAELYGTPLFIYDRDIVHRQYLALRRALPKRLSISYSVKANPNPAILAFFVEQGCGLEIASAGEFHQALAVGCAPAEILFAGPGKTESQLELVISQGIGEIHAESELEIARISAISRRLGVRTKVAVRINPNEDAQGGAMRMGGKPAPFGIDEEQMEPVLCRIVRDPFLDFRGIHISAGTQILDHNVLLAQYRNGLEIAKRVAIMVNRPLHTVDLGGGLGIPYFPGERSLDLEQFKQGLDCLMDEIDRDTRFACTNFIVEPGRFLVAEAGLYVARVNDIKTSRGKKYVILDGGMNHHLAASGNLGQTIKRNFPIEIVNRPRTMHLETVDVVGPLCTPLDTLGRSVQVSAAEVGDLVGIFHSGAYSRTASPLAFLSHVTPPEIWVEGGRDFLIRRRGTPEDFVHDVQSARAFKAAS